MPHDKERAKGKALRSKRKETMDADQRVPEPEPGVEGGLRFSC